MGFLIWLFGNRKQKLPEMALCLVSLTGGCCGGSSSCGGSGCCGGS